MRTSIIAVALAAIGCGDASTGSEFGELVECYSYPEGSPTQRYVVETEPGDVVTHTGCRAYYREGGSTEPRLGDADGCVSWTETADSDEVVIFCSDTLADEDGNVYYEEGFEEVYVKVEAS